MFATTLKEHDEKLRQEVRQKTIQEKAKEDARRMLERDCDIQFIHEITGLSIEEIEKLKE
ncbi:MAG: hypothetical protein ACLFR1_15475 [Spirochaetia bacterium]